MSEWFVVTIVLKCEIDGKPTNPDEWTCIQQIHLVRAVTRDEAYEKALSIGRYGETSYENKEGKKVSWEFVGLENLERLEKKAIRDGIEVWSRVFHTENPDALTVEKEGLSIFHIDRIKDLPASEIIGDGFETKLVCNRSNIVKNPNI